MELKDFLIKAKKATYANASVEKVAASRRGMNYYGVTLVLLMLTAIWRVLTVSRK